MEILETVKQLEDQAISALESVQEPVLGYVSKAVGQVDSFLPADRPTLPLVDQLPDVTAVIDNAFGFAQRVLKNQHTFAKALAEAVAPLYAPAKPVAKPKSAPKAA
jgi:hypothetical protein